MITRQPFPKRSNVRIPIMRHGRLSALTTNAVPALRPSAMSCATSIIPAKTRSPSANPIKRSVAAPISGMPKRGYHHGNLKQALVEAALLLIEAKGPAGFTLSEAAKQAGVTPAAVYRHFAGRDDLIAE